MGGTSNGYDLYVENKGKLEDFIQEAHRDDENDEACYNFSLIVNISDEPAYLKVALGSHKFTGEEQKARNMHNNMTMYEIPPGRAVLFYRQLLHCGTAYRKLHLRLFSYVDIWPERRAVDLMEINPHDTYRLSQPPPNNRKRNPNRDSATTENPSMLKSDEKFYL